jgi:putative ABC transport system permease protein
LIYFLTSFLRGIRQDLRSKELKWLLVALIISVSALTSVSFLADRMHRAFEFDARQLLASDLLIAADQPLPAQLIEEAQSRQLRIAQTVVFPSMATAGEHSKLASLKAVSPEYPLRGSLQVEQVNSQAPTLSPVSGTVFVEPALLTNLHTKVGDSLRLGDRQFLISGVLT